jgi:6-phosphogluconolactonase
MIVDVVRHPSAEDLAEATAARVITTLVETVSDGSIAHLCLTGGGIGTAVLSAVREGAGAVDWSRVHIWWGDERFLPAGDPDRNETGARETLLDHIRIPGSNVHAVPTPAQADDDVDRAAEMYARELAQWSASSLRDTQDPRVPSMDIMLLGVGPDAHVASLFPEHPAVHATGATTGVHGSPKPPSLRVTMTFQTIRAAQQVWLLASGAAKARAMALALYPGAGEFQVPAAGARGLRRTLVLLDDAAASRLPADLGRPGA